MYYTDQPYSARKPKTQINKQQENSDSDKEESMSTSEAGTNSQKGDSDEESSTSFQTVEEKDVGFSSKTNWQEERGEPCHKKKKEEEKCVGSEMEFMISQLTAIVRSWRNMSSRTLLRSSGRIVMTR